MWDTDSQPLLQWIENVYELLAPHILDQTGGLLHELAREFSLEQGDGDLEPTDIKYAVKQLLDRGFLYEVDDELFVTDPDRE